MLTGRNEDKFHRESVIGVAWAGSAFLIWGLSPIYWKSLKMVPSFEILMHRMIWSFLFLMPLLMFKKGWTEFTALFKSLRMLSILVLTTLMVGTNWFIFIWAINHDHILQTSLGYYINPLINVFLGMVFLKERLRPMQITAVILAGIGVGYMTISYGKFPWIALCLAFSFGFYGLIRKIAPVSALAGLSMETLLLSMPALVYLFYLNATGSGAFLHMNIRTDMLLMGTALLTALPLLLFTMGARRIHFSTVGFLQYIAPGCSFLLAIWIYEEPLAREQLITFILIWTALFIYSADALSYYRKVACKAP